MPEEIKMTADLQTEEGELVVGVLDDSPFDVKSMVNGTVGG